LHYSLTSTATNAILLAEKPLQDSLYTTREAKEALFGAAGLSEQELALQPQAKVISYQHAKDIKLWEENFHQFKLTSACSPTLDKGLIVIAAIKQQMRFVGLYRNDAQKELVDATCLEFLFKSSLEDDTALYFVSRAELLTRLGYEHETKISSGGKRTAPDVLRSLFANAAKTSGDKPGDKPDEVDNVADGDEDMEEELAEEEEEEEDEEPKDEEVDDIDSDLEDLFGPTPKKQKTTAAKAKTKPKAKAKPEAAKAKAKDEAEAINQAKFDKKKKQLADANAARKQKALISAETTASESEPKSRRAKRVNFCDP
jgi:hypothetical protein